MLLELLTQLSFYLDFELLAYFFCPEKISGSCCTGSVA